MTSSTITQRSELYKEVFEPLFFRTNNNEEKQAFNKLCHEHILYFHDEIFTQLKELIKIRNPSRPLTADDYAALIVQHLSGNELADYGVWVYYPWNGRMVHILDEAEFVEVRTSRNQYKITTAERDQLAAKKVGVIGLSVGQSVSVTMAMERSCGELRLADFDELELTNYNRIRTGLHNLGIKKVIAVAREIAEIDPFLSVKCYPEGITEENIQDFIDDGTGKLDLLIDECDSVDIKILCRIKAKEARVPVLMEASDRGTVDVERFDLEPERPILHGKIDHLDLSKLKDLTSYEDKVPYILPIAGTDTLSTRMKASMLEIGRTITTWPQLASAVALGGGVTADVARRIFLDEYHESGRYFIDMEELIADKERKTDQTPAPPAELTAADMQALIKELPSTSAEGRLTPDVAVIKEIVAAGSLAPSKGNAQPWKWLYNNGLLYLFFHEQMADPHALKPAVIALGAAVENVVLKAHEKNIEVETTPFPLGESSPLFCIFSFGAPTDGKEEKYEPHLVDALAAAIPHRVTNRTITAQKAIDPSRLGLLVQAAETAGARLKILTDEDSVAQAGEIIAKAERLRLLDRKGHEEFVRELIWNGEGEPKVPRGINIKNLKLKPSEEVAYRMVRNKPVVEYLGKWDAGYALEWFSRKYILGASAIGLITMPENDLKNFYFGGRALERAWLAATGEGISFHPLNAPLTLFYALEKAGEERFAPKIRQELLEMQKTFKKMFSLGESDEAIVLFRVFMSDEPAPRPQKIPVENLLSLS